MPPENPVNPVPPAGPPSPAGASPPAPAGTGSKLPVPPATAAARPAAAGAEDLSRRKFLGLISWSGLGWAAFSAASGVGSIATGRFMFPNVLYELPATVKVGPPDDYPSDDVYEKYKDSNGVWIVRDAGQITALITVCTHLGCTPNWLPNEGKIKCPCHGSGFRRNGINFEGPAPRPLERAKIVLLEDGNMMVDKARKFQYEKGEWNDPDSFIPVTA
ncbi:MAG: ubiquinol-cytochrome c reductase iron-sulfur subunit [Planctomycetes bacterium]|nr:ubiquinol-cytochrome c reductase iron-sulfur subunit [Planctomycetota bacterium]